jgi:hypothetical protein
MTREVAIAKPPTRGELVHRQAVVAKILANADKHGISPLTSADLVNRARQEREEAYERWTH